MSLLKTSINIRNYDISPDADDESVWSEFEHDLELLESDIDSCMVYEEGVEVVTVITDYIARQTNKNTKYDLCQESLTRNRSNLSNDNYLKQTVTRRFDNTINTSCPLFSQIFCNSRLCKKYPIEFQITPEKT